MIAKFYGRLYAVEHLLSLTRQQQEGASMLGLSEAAEAIGMHTVGAKLTYQKLIDDIPLPGIAHWRGKHFVVVVDANETNVMIADPAADGIVVISRQRFLEGWVGSETGEDREGVILLMEPTVDFFQAEKSAIDKGSPGYIWQNLLQYKPLLWYIGAGVIFGAILTVVFPFILQTMVDEGIERQDTNLLNLVLFAWLTLFICQTGLDFIRRFTLHHVGSRVNIRMLTDFMMKMLRLPLRFFQTRMPDDVMQILYDNPRLQRFLANDLVSVIYGSFLLILYSLVLALLYFPVFVVFLGFSTFQILSVRLSLKKRKRLNYERHDLAASHYSKLSDIIRGVKDIRLTNAEKTQRWAWERSEARLYRAAKSFALTDDLANQAPQLLSEVRNIFIVWLCAKAVMNAEISVGVLVAILFIITQLGNPLSMLIRYFLGWQEAKQTLGRMNEIHRFESVLKEGGIDDASVGGDIEAVNLSFRYDGPNSPWIFKGLDFKIKEGTTTAIIGPTGSGKTTLLHLLLNFFQSEEGLIKVGDLPVSEIRNDAWLEKCGVVMQDGHIFYDTIARNIALGEEIIDSQRLVTAARIANVLPFIERFKDGLQTVIGEGGTGLSKGQKQCILIARAIYKDPDYLFLDEATNDLDRETEAVVLQQIQKAFKGRTIVIITNRMELPIKINEYIPMSLPKPKSLHELSRIRGGNGNVNGGQFEEKFFPN
jgi:ATP-binding cassette subfamily B protein